MNHPGEFRKRSQTDPTQKGCQLEESVLARFSVWCCDCFCKTISILMAPLAADFVLLLSLHFSCFGCYDLKLAKLERKKKSKRKVLFQTRGNFDLIGNDFFFCLGKCSCVWAGRLKLKWLERKWKCPSSPPPPHPTSRFLCVFWFFVFVLWSALLNSKKKKIDWLLWGI